MNLLRKRFPFDERSKNITVYRGSEAEKEFPLDEKYERLFRNDSFDTDLIIVDNGSYVPLEYDLFVKKYLPLYKNYGGFEKKDRSSFKYWFAHWCAFNMTAIVLGIWRPKYLLHDIEKPWMRLFCEYKTVQQWHRKHNNHHMEYYLTHGEDESKMDWVAMIIDWECSRHTKNAAGWDAGEQLERECAMRPECEEVLRKNITPIIDNLMI